MRQHFVRTCCISLSTAKAVEFLPNFAVLISLSFHVTFCSICFTFEQDHLSLQCTNRLVAIIQFPVKILVLFSNFNDLCL